MELESKWYSIDLTTKELLDLIPESVYDKLEKQILKLAKDKYNEPFTSIDFYESEGKFQFGVGT